jgi:hypothetical protein
VKGVSSRLIAATFSDFEHFAWQEGYGVFSLSRTDLDKVIDYIQGQKHHHSAGKVWPSLEETDEESPSQDTKQNPTARP